MTISERTGLRFEHCYATALCRTTRAQILTGRYGFRTGWPTHHDAGIYGGGGLNGANSYTGNTTGDGGTLLTNGNLTLRHKRLESGVAAFHLISTVWAIPGANVPRLV